MNSGERENETFMLLNHFRQGRLSLHGARQSLEDTLRHVDSINHVLSVTGSYTVLEVIFRADSLLQCLMQGADTVRLLQELSVNAVNVPSGSTYTPKGVPSPGFCMVCIPIRKRNEFDTVSSSKDSSMPFTWLPSDWVYSGATSPTTKSPSSVPLDSAASSSVSITTPPPER